MKNNLLICDVESGGTDCNKNPITQVTLEVIEPNNFETLHYFETFVQPYNNLIIEPEALVRSRVTMQQVKGGVEKNVLMKGLVNAFKVANKSGRDQTQPYFVGHNFGFDIQFFEYFFTFMNKNLYDFVNRFFFDTLPMMKLYEGDSLKSNENQKYTLTSCCERLGIILHNAHGASADVAATKELFETLTNLQRNGNANVSSGNGGSTEKRNRSSARGNFHFEF